MPTIVLPIEGLTVSTTWEVGAVLIRPANEQLADLETAFTPESFASFERSLEAQASGAFASVEADDIDQALVLVTQAVDVLRVFQHAKYYTVELSHFGVAGEMTWGVVPYAQIVDAGAGHGWTVRGKARGWSFADDGLWADSAAFQWLARTVGATDPSEAQRRALVGTQLLSQALMEPRPAFRMVQLVTALEAWLLERHGTRQTYRLARAVSYFGCGLHDSNLCGRSRETCSYLELEPGVNDEYRRLKKLREKGAAPPWRCSEWHRVVDWYDDRSDVVHGGGPDIGDRESRNALHWALYRLTEPILEWLSDHPDNPSHALDVAIRSLPPAPNWEKRLGAL